MPALLEQLSEQDMETYAGQWVAVRDGEVLKSGATPQVVADWLRKHDTAADFVYRVPARGEPTTYFF